MKFEPSGDGVRKLIDANTTDNVVLQIPASRSNRLVILTHAVLIPVTACDTTSVALFLEYTSPETQINVPIELDHGDVWRNSNNVHSYNDLIYSEMISIPSNTDVFLKGNIINQKNAKLEVQLNGNWLAIISEGRF